MISTRRPALLLGTALGSTLFLATASPAFAAVVCSQPGPAPILQTATVALVCVNSDDRVGAAGEDAISLSTTGNNSDISLTNSGDLTAVGPAPFGHGIYTSTNGVGADITINNAGYINSFNHGIMATDDGLHNGTSNDTYVSITNSGDIDTWQGAGLYGRASYGAGNVVEIYNTGAITTGVNTSPIGGATAIFAAVGGDNGLAKVTNDGAITTVGDTAAGISAVASYYHGNNSDIIINNGVHGTIIASGDGAFGIFASAGSVDPYGGVPNANNSGTIVIDNAASITSGYHGIGAFTYGTNGTITLTNSGAVTSGTGTSLYAETSNDNADLVITNSGKLIAQGDSTVSPTVAHGIYAATNGLGADITINNSGAIESSGHAIMATDDGSHSGTSDDTHVSITNSGKIDTGKGAGLYGRASYGAGNVVEIYNTGAITTGVNTSPIGGATAIFAAVGGNGGLAKVTNDGVLTTVGDTAAGISAVASYYHGNNSDIVINNGVHGTIIANGASAFGIFASAGSVDPYGGVPNANNGGTIIIDNAASVTSGYGIGAYTYGTGGDITLTNSGSVSSNAAGTTDSDGLVAVANGTNAVVSITDSGKIDVLGHGIVGKALGSGSSLTVNANGVVHGGVGGILIDAIAPATLNVGVGGSVDATSNLAVSATGAALTLNNGGGIYGRLALGNAGDTFNNLGTGYFRTITNSDFGGGTDVVNNSGVIDASGGGSGVVAFTGLETLNNTGGLVSLIDGHAGDHLTTSGNFVGSGNSLVGLDVDFSNPGVADVYTIQGNSSGTTDVVINPTSIGTGTPHVGDIAVIVVNGTTSEPDFNLVGGIVNAGFNAYDLFLDSDNHTHELRYVGIGNAAYELPAGVTGAQDLWQDGFDLWQDRMANARDHHADNVGNPVAWVQAAGSWSHLDPSITFEASGRTETLNLDNSQSMGGIVGGIDVNTGSFNGGDLIVGATAGYITSVLDFDATDDFWQYRGASLGAYASYLKSGFFVNGAVKVDLLRVSINNRQGAVVADAEASATSLGARVDVGYRMDTSWGFLEPKVSLQGATTSMGDVNLFGSDVTFQDGTSGRVTAALRVGAKEIDRGDVKIAPSLTFSVWNDLGGMNSANIGVPIGSSTANNPGSSLFGGISANIDIIGRNGWSGGLQGSFKTSSDTQGGSLGASLHYHW